MVVIKKNLIFDYLVMSFKVTAKQAECFTNWLYRFINFPVDDCESIKSHYGLQHCLFYRGIKVHTSAELIILDCSGKGCRSLEALNKDFDWYQFLHTFDYFIKNKVQDGKTYAVNFARVDVACDLLEDERITVPFLQNYVRQNKFLCKSEWHLNQDGNHEMAVLFGSPRSDRRLRIYDKAMEQGIENYKWVRFEFQLRNDNATSFYLNLSETCAGDFVKCYYGMLHDYLRFITQSNDGMNSNRKKVCPWWRSFLEDVGKISQLYLPADDYDLPSLSHFLAYQCSSSIRTFLEANGGDVTELVAMAQAAKLNKKQNDLLDDLRVKQEEQNKKITEIICTAPALNRKESLIFAKAQHDIKALEERRKHWTPLGCSLDPYAPPDDSDLEKMATQDLEF